MLHIVLAASVLLVGDLTNGTQPSTLTVGLAELQPCASCHRDDVAATSVMPSDTYRATMMNLSGVDPFFLASLEIAKNDNLAASELCVKCHYPSAWLAGRGGNGGANLTTADKNGITCDFCHRTEPPETRADFPNDHGIDDPARMFFDNAGIFVANDSAKRGPREDPAVTGGHQSIPTPYFAESRYCGACHDVSSVGVERVDATTGLGMGQVVPYERTYSEWLQSDLALPDGKSCQQCHMVGQSGRAAKFGNPPVRDVASHTFAGGNTIVPLMVATQPLDTLPFDLTGGVSLLPAAQRVVAAARQNLTEDSLTLEALALVDDENGLALRVRVTNLTGHKLPTGYAEGRRMWIAHAVTAADGQNGPRTGTPTGPSGDIVAGEDPVRTWEIKHGTPSEPNGSFHFILVDRIAKDNRIPPRGFRPSKDTEIIGHTYPVLDGGKVAHYDDVDLPLGEDGGCWPRLVDVNIYYQTASGEYFRFLVANAPTAGPALQAAWNATSAGTPVRMKSLQVAVGRDGSIVPATTPPACIPLPVIPPDAVPSPDLPADGGTRPPPADEEAAGYGCGQGATAVPATWILFGVLLLPLSAARRRLPGGRRAPRR